MGNVNKYKKIKTMSNKERIRYQLRKETEGSSLFEKKARRLSTKRKKSDQNQSLEQKETPKKEESSKKRKASGNVESRASSDEKRERKSKKRDFNNGVSPSEPRPKRSKKEKKKFNNKYKKQTPQKTKWDVNGEAIKLATVSENRKRQETKIKHKRFDSDVKYGPELTKKIGKWENILNESNDLSDDADGEQKQQNPTSSQVAIIGIKKRKKLQPDVLAKLSAQLKGARFRFINEMLYTQTSAEAQKAFEKDPSMFDDYHKGYTLQRERWPCDPLDAIISQLRMMPNTLIVADLGCGNATLAKSVPQIVHSFDLVSTDELVTAADMANLPLTDESVDVCVYCLALMGTNLNEFMCEANRILRPDGLVKIAEIRSRFGENYVPFLKTMLSLGFKCVRQAKIRNYYVQLDFRKVGKPKSGAKPLKLQPCLYKKR